VTRFLRFVGVLNLAIWLGAAVFLALAARPALSSQAMKETLGAGNYPFFSEEILRIVLVRYLYVQLVCGVIAVVHLFAEKLYLGKSPDQGVLTVLVCLLIVSGLQGGVIQPKLKALNRAQYTSTPQNRQAAQQSFGTWKGILTLSQLFTLGALTFSLWRTANPPETPRFISSGQFRS
jgi:hypothetical protein